MRTRTPTRHNSDGSFVLTVQRCCNGCYREIGDATEEELLHCVNGSPLPDVRHECPACAMFLEEVDGG